MNIQIIIVKVEMDDVTIFFVSLLMVYMLGISSSLVRDKNCIGAFLLAWFILLSNMFYIKVFVMSDELYWYIYAQY
jgi:hypothetical protein